VESASPRPAPRRVGPPRGAVPAKSGRLGRNDRQLLDLLARKEDAPSAALALDPGDLETERGGLAPTSVEGVLAKSRGAFDACISKALRIDPNMKVTSRRATLVVTVQPSGAVTAVSIAEPEIERGLLGPCFVTAARRMTFPSFAGEATDVSIPLSLSAIR
jgi:hypothetical protein